MSIKASKHYWECGPAAIHAFYHCADTQSSRVWWLLHLGNRCEIQLWPIRPHFRRWEQRLKTMADIRRALSDAARRSA